LHIGFTACGSQLRHLRDHNSNMDSAGVIIMYSEYPQAAGRFGCCRRRSPESWKFSTERRAQSRIWQTQQMMIKFTKVPCDVQRPSRHEFNETFHRHSLFLTDVAQNMSMSSVLP
jgi:hypothetical protein